MILFQRSAARRCLWTLILMGGLASLIAAQPKPAASGHGVVDVVSLKSSRVLRGAIAWREPDGSLTMVVSLDWLRGANPMLAVEALTDNQTRRKAAWTQTRDRIAERLKSSDDSPPVKFLMKQELERINRLISDPSPAEPDFLWFDITHESISKVIQATPEQRSIAAFAWNERLNHVETRDITSLSKELKSKGVKLEGSPQDLAERLSARPQTDEEWSARMAVVEYTLDKPVDFQGMGDTLVRTGEGQTINLGEVLPKIFQQQLGSLFKDLLNDGRANPKPQSDVEWLKPAIRQAEAAKSRGFRVSRLEIDASSMRVTVETRFVAQTAAGKWRSVWRTTVTEDGAKARPQSEARIEQDPQLKSAVDTLKSLGLADAQTLQQAIRVGAATMAAQQTADAAFSEFRDRYVRSLDGPPLRLIVP